MKPELAIQVSAKELKGKHKQLEALIEGHPFMKGLGASHLATLADCAMKTEFAPGHLIFREGDIANRFYVILEGSANRIGISGANCTNAWRWWSLTDYKARVGDCWNLRVLVGLRLRICS